MAVKTMLEAIREGLAQEMRRDPSVIVLGEDVGVHGGVFRTTDGLLREFGEDRVIDTPLAEVAIAGVAIGASVNGLRPVAEIQFADYIYPAVDQIVNEASKIRYRSNGAFGCPLVIRAPCGAGVRGGPYHSQSPESMFLHVPGLKVVVPATPYDAKGLLVASIRDEDPVLFFEPKKLYRRAKGEVPEDEYEVPLGVAEIKRPGSSLSVITYGAMVPVALEAAEAVAVDGISPEVVDLRTILPMDRDTILSSVRKTGRVLILHEDTITGGVGAEVAAIIAQEAFDHLDAPIVRVAAPDTPVPYSAVLEDAFLPNRDRLVQAIGDLMAY